MTNGLFLKDETKKKKQQQMDPFGKRKIKPNKNDFNVYIFASNAVI